MLRSHLQEKSYEKFSGYSGTNRDRFWLVMRLQEHGLIAIDGQKVCWNACRQEVA